MKDTTVIIIALIVVAVILAPSVFSAFGGIWDDIMDFVKYGFEDWTGSSTGFATLGVTVKYKDGTTKQFKPDDMSILPLTITDDGGEIESYVAEIYVTMTHNAGSSNSYVITGDYWSSSNDETPQIWFTQNETWTFSGSDWTSGDQKLCKSYTYTASYIEQKMSEAGWDYGIHRIAFVTQVQAELTDSYGNVAIERTGTTFAQPMFVWEATLTIYSLEVSITPVILRP